MQKQDIGAKIITNSFGGEVLEQDGKYYLYLPKKSKFNKKELTKKDMKRFIDSYKGINVINKPGLVHTFEMILNGKCNHGLDKIIKTIDKDQVNTIRFTAKEEDFSW